MGRALARKVPHNYFAGWMTTPPPGQGVARLLPLTGTTSGRSQYRRIRMQGISNCNAFEIDGNLSSGAVK